LSGGSEKNCKSSVCVDGLPVKIRNENFPNVSKGIHQHVPDNIVVAVARYLVEFIQMNL
jgi:hypothetical protein